MENHNETHHFAQLTDANKNEIRKGSCNSKNKSEQT
jgi:hypothetical protein